MQLQDYLRTLRRGWIAIVVSVVVALGLGGLLIASSEETYAATAELFVAPGTTEITTEVVQGSRFYENRVKTYAMIVDSATVLDPVIGELGLETDAKTLAGQVSADAPIETVLLRIRVTDPDPAEAAAIANAVAEQFSVIAPQLESRDESGEDSVVRISIVNPATEPSAPIAPNKRLILGLAVLLGLAIGFAIAVFREALNNRVRSESDLKAITDVPVVGKIPRKERGDPPLLVDDAAHGLRAEAFRRLRTNLRYLDIAGEHQTLVITSALPGEGKSVTATNLALTIANAGPSVCIVEADLRRPWTSRLLDLQPEVGLSSVIIGSATLDQAVQTWGDTGVDVLAAGPLPPNPSELLSSTAMDALLDALEQRYDYIIIDAPPLLAVTDAAIVARRAGGAIVVVSNRGRRTVTRDQLLEAFDSLESTGSSVLGVVLNRQPTRGPDAIALSEYAYAGAPDQRGRTNVIGRRVGRRTTERALPPGPTGREGAEEQPPAPTPGGR